MKKTLAILLSAVMMLGLLAGCGSKTTEQPSTSGTLFHFPLLGNV